jgi:hypothetical protein
MRISVSALLCSIGSAVLLCACQAGQKTPAGAAHPTQASLADAPFPPEGVDHLALAVLVDVEIFAIGKDQIELEGTAAVHRSGPRGPGGKEMVGELIGASFRGKSNVFGEVIAVQSPIQRSPCRYTAEGPGRYRGGFEINGWFWLPEHQLLVFSAAPVDVEGTAAGIPPVGQKAELTSGEIALHDFRNPRDLPIGLLTRASAEVRGIVRIEEHLRRPERTVAELAR